MNRLRIFLIILLVIVFAGSILFYFTIYSSYRESNTIKVGILHSLTGTMANSEKPVVNATLLAIDEINEKGGLLGKKIEPVILDGKSDAAVFSLEAQNLIVHEKVSVVFGCWTSTSRKAVKPIFEKYNHLLFYPVQYEGLEESLNIVYTGAAPNQQLIPAVKWCFDNFGKRFFLVGSDYIYPRTANEIIKLQLANLKGEIVGEEYQPLGCTDFKEIVKKIALAKPDVIINTINGDSNIAFFINMHNDVQRETDDFLIKTPIMSMSIAEAELSEYQKNMMKYVKLLSNDRNKSNFNPVEMAKHIWNDHVVDNYACCNYFQSINTEKNRQFVKRYKEKYGALKVVDDPMEAGYFGVYLWAQAVLDSNTDKVEEVRNKVVRQSFNAPEGIVYVDENRHTWKTVRIGQIQENGQFSILWKSNGPVKPNPFPFFKSKEEWNRFLKNQYDQWKQNWAVPQERK